MVDIAKSIARFLREAVRGKRILQRELAEAANVSEQAASKWMRTGKVSLESLVAIADKMNVSLDEIVGRTPPALHAVPATSIQEAPAAPYVHRLADIQKLTADRRAIVWRVLDALLSEQAQGTEKSEGKAVWTNVERRQHQERRGGTVWVDTPSEVHNTEKKDGI